MSSTRRFAPISKLRAFFADERHMAAAKAAQMRHWAQITEADFGVRI